MAQFTAPDKKPVRTSYLMWLGVVMSLALFSLHDLVGMAVNHGDYTPFSVAAEISYQEYDETQLYAPGPVRFLRTGRLDSEVDVIELRRVSNGYPVVHSILLGAMAGALGLDRVWLLSHALFPALVWLLLFWIARRLLMSDGLAFAAAWITCLVPFGPRNALLLGVFKFLNPLELSRLPHPAISFLALMLASWWFARTLAAPSRWRIVIAAMLGGVLFYQYYFDWISFFGGVGLLLVLALFTGRWRFAKTPVVVLAAAPFLGLPFFLRTLAGMRSGYQQNLMVRVGAFTHAPDRVGLVLACVLLGALWVFYRRRIGEKSTETEWFFAVLLAVATGAAIGLNLQVITGYDAQHRLHFANRVFQPIVAFLLLLALPRFRLTAGRVWTKPLLLAAATIMLAVGVLREVKVGLHAAPFHRSSNPDLDVLRWAREHLPADIVLASSDNYLLSLIPGIAGTWNFVPKGDRSMASNEDTFMRYLLLCHLEGRTWQEVETELTTDLGFPNNSSSMSYTLDMERPISARSLEIARQKWEQMEGLHGFENRRLDYWITRRSRPAAESAVEALQGQTVYQNDVWRLSRIPALSR